MSGKPFDEWGLVIKKQIEFESVISELEKNRHKIQQENYRKELDGLLAIKEQQRIEARNQKAKELDTIANQLKIMEAQDKNKRFQQFESQKKIVEENLKLQKMISEQKDTQKLTSLREDIHYSYLDQERLMQGYNKKLQKRKIFQKEMTENIKTIEEKQSFKKQINMFEKEQELMLAKQEEDRLNRRDLTLKNQLLKIQETQNKKVEVFNQNITPKLYEKEQNYNSWLKNAEEAKRKEEIQMIIENRRKRSLDTQIISESLRKQSEEREVIKSINKEKNRAIDEELQKRIEFSIKIDQDRNLKKKYEALSYREELLNQAALNKEKRLNELRLNEKERLINRSILEQDKSSFQRRANEILRSSFCSL